MTLPEGYDEMDFDDRKKAPEASDDTSEQAAEATGDAEKAPGSPTKLKTLPRPLQRPPKKNLERHPQKESLKKPPRRLKRIPSRSPKTSPMKAMALRMRRKGIHPTKNLPVTNRSTFLSIQNFIFSIIKYHVYI